MAEDYNISRIGVDGRPCRSGHRLVYSIVAATGASRSTLAKLAKR